MAYRLPDALRLGPVRLQVTDLAQSLAFYEQVLGMRVLARTEAEVSLGAQGDGRVLVVLVEKRGAMPHPGRGRTGLFHFAILLPDRPSLGRFVKHLAALGVRAGAGDHLVSEAFYLSDPDGLGIEVYADRPRDTWTMEAGELKMATDPVDVASVVASAGATTWSGMPAGTVMGHVHLHVGDIDRAGSFYADALGFDRVVRRYPGALFMSAGGYHHHLGTNTWAGPLARAAEPHEAQLLEWTIELPSAQDVDAVAQALAQQGVAVTRAVSGSELVVRDPWGTPFRVRTIVTQ